MWVSPKTVWYSQTQCLLFNVLSRFQLKTLLLQFLQNLLFFFPVKFRLFMFKLFQVFSWREKKGCDLPHLSHAGWGPGLPPRASCLHSSCRGHCPLRSRAVSSKGLGLTFKHLTKGFAVKISARGEVRGWTQSSSLSGRWPAGIKCSGSAPSHLPSALAVWSCPLPEGDLAQ